jgi:HlyD family secretion protein
MPGPPSGRSSVKPANAREGSAQRVWTLQNDQPVSVPVTIGPTNGQSTEVVSGGLHEGMQLITNTAEEK